MTEDTTAPLDKNATRFELDDRQRAMLAEMGVRVWMPQTVRALPVKAAKLAQVAVPHQATADAAASVAVSVAATVASTPQMLSVPLPVHRKCCRFPLSIFRNCQKA